MTPSLHPGVHSLSQELIFFFKVEEAVSGRGHGHWHVAVPLYPCTSPRKAKATCAAFHPPSPSPKPDGGRGSLPGPRPTFPRTLHPSSLGRMGTTGHQQDCGPSVGVVTRRQPRSVAAFLRIGGCFGGWGAVGLTPATPPRIRPPRPRSPGGPRPLVRLGSLPSAGRHQTGLGGGGR